MLVTICALVSSSIQAQLQDISPLGQANGIHTKFDYKQTFKYPFFTTTPTIPYFNKTGQVLVNQDLVRIVPSMAFKFGSLWCETPNPHNDWMVEFSMSIYGRSENGGEGFAFWYTKDPKPPTTRPDFYGQSAKFTGMAIIFDHSDLKSDRYNPFIYGIESNGHKTIHDFDSYTSANVNFGSCFREYRNSPTPVFVKVIYSKGILTLSIDIRQGGHGYLDCFTAPLILPVGYHFGISASTSENEADDHDFYSFETYELNPGKKEAHPRPSEKEHIDKHDPFIFDEDLQSKIKATESKIKKLTEEKQKTHQNNFDHTSLAHLESNQFHIMESLDMISRSLKINPTTDHVTKIDQEGLEQRFGEHVELLRNDLISLQRDIEDLHETTSNLKHLTEQLSSALHVKLDSAGKVLEGVHASSSILGTAVQIFAGLAGVAIIALVWAVFIRSGGDNVKKFV